MARGKKKADTGNSSDSILASITESVSNRFQESRIYSGDERVLQTVCLPVPAFSIRYLLQQEGWPLGFMTQIVGEQESCKSAFLYEILGWHMNYSNGCGVLLETEGKVSPELPYSIFGYNHPRFRLQPCTTLQEWNAVLKDWVEKFVWHMAGNKEAKIEGKGKLFPVCFGIDSLMAALPDKIYDKIDTEGASSKHFADAAGLINDYLKYIIHPLKTNPFSFVGINHMKPRQVQVPGTAIMKTERNIAGGYSPKFHETTEIQMTRMSDPRPGKEINRIRDEEKGIALKIAIYKNSMAPHAQIEVEFLWYMDYDDPDPQGNYRQKSYFDWHSASIEILIDMQKGDGKKAKQVREVLEIEADRDLRRASCSALGVKSKSKLRYQELGVVLEEKIASDPEFAKRLYAETYVRRRNILKEGVDYDIQMEEAARANREAESQALEEKTKSKNKELAESIPNGDVFGATANVKEQS